MKFTWLTPDPRTGTGKALSNGPGNNNHDCEKNEMCNNLKTLRIKLSLVLGVVM